MPLPDTMATLVFPVSSVRKLIEGYKPLSSATGTNPAAKVVIPTFPYYFSETVQEALNMINRYLKKGLVQLKLVLKDAFHHANSRVNIYIRLYLDAVCPDQRKCGYNVLKDVMFAYYSISRIIISNGALANYSPLEMLLSDLLR
jgi:hypothetical protein